MTVPERIAKLFFLYFGSICNQMRYTANVYIGSAAEVHFFCVILEKITRIYLLSLVHKKSANNTHFMCNWIAVNMCIFYTRRNAIFTSE